MSDGSAIQSAAHVKSRSDYERRLRRSMRLVSHTVREDVVREITGGIDSQVQAAGGDFSRVAPQLDDPAWVGRRMVQVYGPSGVAKAALLGVGLLFAAASVPGLLLQPPDSAGSMGIAFLAFALLVALIVWGSLRLSPSIALVAAVAALLARTAGLFIAVGEFAPIQSAHPGEVALYVISSLLVVVVAGVLAAVSRLRRGPQGE